MITIIPELSGLIQLNQMLVEREGCVDRTFRWPGCCDCFAEISGLAVPAGIRAWAAAALVLVHLPRR